MYIKRILIENYGPIENLEINLQFNDQGEPNVLMLVGKNGSGKTLLLSSIVDGFFELKRQHYNFLKEINENKYFKFGSKLYIQSGKDYSFIKLEFSSKSNILRYTDVMTFLNHGEFISKYGSKMSSSFNIHENHFVINGFYKKCDSGNSDIKADIDNNTLLYFPFGRNELPAWLNPENKVVFKKFKNIVGESKSEIVKSNVIEEIEIWILDLVLDKELFEKKFVPFGIQGGTPNMGLPLFIGYEGKNTTMINLINELLTTIYRIKFNDLEHARIGINPKGARSVAVFVKYKGKEEYMVAHSLSQLSSGESMVLAMFCSILKDYDQLNNNQITNLGDVSGIVVIDEIDLHLHVEFQKEIIPALIKKFPKVQFVISTHSPLLVLGMERLFAKDVQLVELPLGNEISPAQFSEFQIAYDTYVSKNEQFKTLYEEISGKLLDLEKPMIITEGKTDWKHLKNALKKLKLTGEYQHLNIDFLEYDSDMGDSELLSMCKHFSHLPQKNKIICIFDRDVSEIIRKVEDGNDFKDWGNNVYSFCIPIPSHRINYKKISIEFYYQDNEIKTLDNGRRLYFSNELTGQLSISTKKLINYTVLDAPNTDEEYDKYIFDQDVAKIYNGSGEEIALSKSHFADNIYNEKPEFGTFNVQEFSKIFSVIQRIIKVVAPFQE